MFDMGMISLGKSSLPEFSFTPSAELPDSDATRNPWNLGRSAGGASSGSAALIAAGVLPIPHAADGGGSIRIPGSYCGLVGLKPTRGRLIPPPTDKLMPVQVVVDGVVTRTVRDTAMYFAEAEKRYYNRQLPRIGLVTTPVDRKLRFGAIIKSPVSDVDAPTRAVYEQTTKLLCALLSVRTLAQLAHSPFVGAIWEAFVSTQQRRRHQPALRPQPDRPTQSDAGRHRLPCPE